MSVPERRRQARIPVAAPISVTLEKDRKYSALLLDVHDAGARVCASHPIFRAKGTGVLAAREGTARSFTVVWPDDGLDTTTIGSQVAGVAFDSPLASDDLDVLLKSVTRLPGATPRYRKLSLSDGPGELLQQLGRLWGTRVPVPLDKPVENIVRRMHSAGCAHVIIDDHYRDSSYVSEYLNLYHDIHGQPLFCKRLLFYDDKEELLGSVSLRPIGQLYRGAGRGQLGSARVSPDIVCRRRDDTVSYHGMWTDLPVFDVTAKTSVKCFPFAQQDALGSRCAQVSVQVISQYMRRHLGLRELTFADIRRATALAPAVSYPIQGLDPDGLARALAEIGCAPCTYVRRGFGLGKQWLPLAQERPDFAQMVDLLHVYIDSQLPVVLGLSARSRDSETHHAVCAVGHTIGKTPNPAIAAARNRNRGQGNIHTATEFVRDIIVHDDEVGPYLLLPVATSQMYNKDGTPGQYDTLWKESLQEHLSLMVVPVPFGVHVSASIALKSVRDALTAIASGYELEVQKVGGQASAALVRECGEALKTGSVITNLFLDLGQRVLENVLAVPEAIAEKNQKHLLQMTWPKYVWVAELSTSSLIGRPFSERRTLGFFVLDATTPWGRDVCMLVRLPGLLSCPPVDGEGSGDRRDFPDGHDEFGMLVVRNYMRSGWSKPAPSEEVTGA